MMVSDEVPATSEVIPLIGKYYIGLIFLIFLAAFTTTITLSYQMRGNAGTEVSRLVYFRQRFSLTSGRSPCQRLLFPHDRWKSLYRLGVLIPATS